MAELNEIDVATDKKKTEQSDRVSYMEGIFGPPNVMVETFNLQEENSHGKES